VALVIDGGVVGLLLRAVEVTGPCRWRWLLVDERSGAALADHQVELDPAGSETEAFGDLYRFLWWRADPDRRVASEAEWVRRVGAWIGSVALGQTVGRAVAAAAPVTVRVQVPAGGEFLAFRPWELAHVGGVPLAARGDVSLVYDLPGPPGVGKAPVGAALRMLAVFSLPAATSALALRRERYELSRLVRRVAARGGRRVELEVAQYGVTREVLADLAESGDGWDVLHLSGHGGVGQFLLEHADGSPDPVSTAELVALLRPVRARVKLVVVSACQSAAATTAETLRWLGLDDPATELEAQVAQEAGSATSPVGLARALVAELRCAVVAMRYPVIDDFAVGFAEEFYDRVFRQSQPVDRALAAAVPATAGITPSAARPAISVGTVALFGAGAAGLALAPPPGQPIMDPAGQRMAGFPPEPPRFVGRAEAMAAASTALAPESGRTAVLFHGMAGAGKTACALELAYRHQRAFAAMAFWSAPTDPEQFGDALRRLAIALEAQLGDYRFAMLDKIGTPVALETFLPRLRALLADTGLLLVLDNLETLLTPEGRWRDPRWAPLIGALTGHGGESRLILTSRIPPAGFDTEAVLVRPVHALSRDESLLLARELPNLRALLHGEAEPVRGELADPALGRRVLTLVQGHPKLLELADAAAADRTRLASQLAAAEAAVNGAALSAFLTQGDTTLDAAQFLQTLTAWATDATATLPAPARLLLQALCRIEETDRDSVTLEGTWAALWRRLDQLGDPPPLDEALTPLLDAALVAAEPRDPADLDSPVDYRIHPGIAEATHTTAPEQVSTAVDAELAAWWTTVACWGLKQEQAGQDTGQLVIRAGLAAAPYLLRQHDWDNAGALLAVARGRDRYSPITAHAVIPPLRRIAEATGHPVHLGTLATALNDVDPAEAEVLLRRVYDQATTGSDHVRASAVAGELVTLLCDQGRLREALTLSEQRIAHTRHAGLGSWTQLGDQAQWLHIHCLLGHHEQVLTDLSILRDRMAELPDQPAGNDIILPWVVRGWVLEAGCTSARVLERWEQALDLTNEITTIQRRHGLSAHEIARIRFNNYGPLISFGRLPEADQLLRECQQVFDAAGDITRLGAVYGARADLENTRGRLLDAVQLQRTALRLLYTRPHPSDISASHHNLANYLSGIRADPGEQRAHRLAAGLLKTVIGDIPSRTQTLRTLAHELRGDTDRSEAPALPTTLPEVIRLVDAGEGVHFGRLVSALCPDPDVADRALVKLLSNAAILRDQLAWNPIERHLTEWDPLITAIVAAATNGHTPTELTNTLDELGASTNWAHLIIALRQILAGARDRAQLLTLTGLDVIDTAILTTVLDRLPTSSGQQQHR
jgi:CHAT domain